MNRHMPFNIRRTYRSDNEFALEMKDHEHKEAK